MSEPSKKKGLIGNLTDEARDYVDLKVDEVKLKATQGLSLSMSRILAMLLIVAVLIIVLGLLAVVIIQWLGQAIGIPLASTIVCCVFIIALAVLFWQRKKLFRDTFVKMFIDIFYGSDEDEK